MSDVIATIIEDDSTTNVTDLMAQYNSAKATASGAVSKLTGTFTLGGMDSINVLVADAAKQIQAFTANGKPKSTVSKAGSRALAILDPNNKWAGKWLNNASDAIEEEKFKEKSINEVIDILVKEIETQRDEVVTFIQAAGVVKLQMIDSLVDYKDILAKTEQILTTAGENSKAYFDAEYLISMLHVTIQGIQADIKSQVDPLIAGARISVTQITGILPTIENDLKYKSGFKAFQQKLSDLNGITKTVVDLASNAGDIIRKDINETIYQSLEMIGETGLDAGRLKRIHAEEATHQLKINSVMEKTQIKMQNTFKDIKALSASIEASRENATNTLLENYSKVD